MIILENYRKQKWNEVQQIAASVLSGTTDETDDESEDEVLISVDSEEDESDFEEFQEMQADEFHTDQERRFIHFSDFGVSRQID